MHLQLKYINILINILLGAAWAIAFYGLVLGFVATPGNIFLKFLNALLYSTFGLFLVLLLEAIYILFKMYALQLKNSLE